MNSILPLLSIGLVVLASAHAAPAALEDRRGGGGSSSVGGGGDALEIRFASIAVDLREWISRGGSAALRLPEGVTHAEYDRRMGALLAPHAVTVAMTPDPVDVDGAPKTCRSSLDPSSGAARILCNIARFSATPEADQYRLVHHEYAGLAGLERNEGGSSDYRISEQLVAYLEPRTELRLVVRPSGDVFDPGVCASGPLLTPSTAIAFIGAGNDARAIGSMPAFRRNRKCNAVTGCGEWGPTVVSDRVVDVALGANATLRKLEFRFTAPDSPEKSLSLGWSSEPSADGSVNGCRWWGPNNFLQADSYCSLYARANCVKLHVVSVDPSEEYAVYFRF